MKIIFMGTPDFAVPCLEMLVKEGYEIPLVVSQPDKQRGRGHKISYSPVKMAAIGLGIPVFQPESLRNGELNEKLNEINPDVIVVVAYGKLLPKEILDFPKYGCINVHGSLLPKYRGAAPIQRAIMNGETVTGITIMRLDEGMDTGDMLYKAEVPIDDCDTSGTLFEKLKPYGAAALKTALEKIKNNKSVRVKQDETLATYAPMISKEEALINWGEKPKSLLNKIRGLNPAPAAYTYYNGKKLKIYNITIGEETDDTAYGKIWGYFEDKGLGIVGNGNIIYINEFHMENSKRMAVKEYLKGHTIEPGECFKNTKE